MSARRCRVFISHSADAVEEPDSLVFLEALIAAIAADPELQPIADRTDLQAGDEWMQRLFAWMGLSDAAVVLLSPRAVTRENSVWVPREVNLLMWRKALDERFVVIPVLLGGLDPAALATNPFIADLRLRDLQFPAGVSDADKIGLIVAALRDKLAARRAQLVFDPLRVHVEECLRRFAPPPSVAQSLIAHGARDGWRPGGPEHEALSMLLLRLATGEAVDAVIRSVAMGSLGESRLGARLFEALYPLRLPAESACQLLSQCHELTGRGALLLNAHNAWIVEMLLRAACGLPRDDLLRTWQIIQLTDGWGDDDVGELTQVLAERLAEEMLGTGAWLTLAELGDPLTVLREQLEVARADRGAPVLVCAAFRPRWVELAVALAAQFPTLVFVLWTGDEVPAMAPLFERARGAGGACDVLEPGWPPRRDLAWKIGHDLKLKQFGGATAGG